METPSFVALGSIKRSEPIKMTLKKPSAITRAGEILLSKDIFISKQIQTLYNITIISIVAKIKFKINYLFAQNTEI
jgi:hypothetical protein